MPNAPRLVWYFDFISPFAYLQFAAHPDLFARPDVALRPILFAGLLAHWGHKGPAEIAPKRVHTYRGVVWQAARRGIPLRFPPAHPFNPIHALRLAIALGATQAVVKTIFDFVWAEGRSIGDEWPALCERLGVRDVEALIGTDRVKAALRANGEEAIAAGLFGVPTFAVDGELFWGEDATPMLRDYLANPALFASPEMQRVTSLPAAAERRR
jgi:2-hydroxychromene-2-carboxylate isomerase